MAGQPEAQAESADPVLQAMRTRRVSRHFLDDPVPADALRQILQAAGWASTAGNRSIHRFLVVRDDTTIAQLKPFAPGILALPPAVIVVCLDLDQARAQYVQVERDMNTWIDVGTMLMCMMLACESLGLGSCPATSFSHAAVAQVLALPPTMIPQLILQVGFPSSRPPQRGRGGSARRPIGELTDWEQMGQREPPV